MGRNNLGLGVLLSAFVLSAGACSSSSGGGGGSSGGGGGNAPTTETVKLYSWWIAPGEAQALAALVNTYQSVYKGGKAQNSGTDNGQVSRALLDQVIDTAPPDVFQLNSQDLGPFVTAHSGSVASLDDIFDATVKSAILPDVLAQVTVGGHIVGVPVDVPRENAFFYNKSIFAANNLTPPATVADLLTTCATLKAAGVTPIAVATGPNNGWIAREMFHGLLQGTMGGALFKDFITAAKPVTDPEVSAALKTAIHTLGTIYTQYSNTDGAALGWTDAADKVKNGDAAIYMHGDWVKGYWIATGWTPGVDFGQTGAPGATDLFVYGIDMLGMPTAAPDPVAAKHFLTVAVSADGQAAFSNQKGSSPARTDVGDQLDVLGKATLNELVNAKFRLPVYGLNIWDQALGVFSGSSCTQADEDTLYQVYVTNPPVAAP